MSKERGKKWKEESAPLLDAPFGWWGKLWAKPHMILGGRVGIDKKRGVVGLGKKFNGEFLIDNQKNHTR